MENDNQKLAQRPISTSIPIDTIPTIPATAAPEEKIIANPVQHSPSGGQQPGTQMPGYQQVSYAAPKKYFSSYLYSSFGVLILLAIVLPPSPLSQALAYPVILLGIVSGVKFAIESIRTSAKSIPLFRPFIIIGGIGIGIVIFLACAIAGAVVGFVKDPNPQSTG